MVGGYNICGRTEGEGNFTKGLMTVTNEWRCKGLGVVLGYRAL